MKSAEKMDRAIKECEEIMASSHYADEEDDEYGSGARRKISFDSHGTPAVMSQVKPYYMLQVMESVTPVKRQQRQEYRETEQEEADPNPPPQQQQQRKKVTSIRSGNTRHAINSVPYTKSSIPKPVRTTTVTATTKSKPTWK